MPGVDIDSLLNDRLSGKSSGLGGMKRSKQKAEEKKLRRISTAVSNGISSTSSRKASRANLKPSRSVSFDKFDRVLEIPHINDMSKETKNAVWMNHQEKKQIRKECIAIVDSVNAGRATGSCFRGLEGHTDEALKERQEVQDNVYDAVLGLQEFQRKRGVNLPNAMADIYKKHSARSQWEAHQTAIRDTMAVLGDDFE